ncbi:MAG: isocitrate/isopropylmalate dehydrogenase family protein [Nitrososphaeraceae archaeon]
MKGDGIGPELIDSATTVLETINDHSNVKFTLTECEAGDIAKERLGMPLPDSTFRTISSADASLKGPVGESAADVIVVLRRALDLYANIRPAKAYPNIDCYSHEIDLITVRENTEDLYLGWEFYTDEKTAIAIRLITEKASLRIADYAFRLCRFRAKSKKVVAVHKANVMRKTDGLFLSACRTVATKYPDIEYRESYVDAFAMELIRNPASHDIVLTTNLYGDILSDEAAQLVGGLGMGPAANIGSRFGLFEPVHGAAFDIAGKNIANPSSILLSTKLMLEWLSEKFDDKETRTAGQLIENAIVRLFIANKKTKDVGGMLSTSEFTSLVSASLFE